MLWRLFLTLFILAVAGFVEVITRSAIVQLLGSTAGAQFLNSDAAYLSAQATFRSALLVDILIGGATFLSLAAIWGSLLIEKARGTLPAVALIALAAAALYPAKAYAFAETTDRTEVYSILPNESAFWIPSVGANKDTQAQLDSEDYLKANKIAAKLFTIPHVKLSGTGGIGWLSAGLSDYFVPTGKLIIVDRTTYSREWVVSKDRGTASANQGQFCQTSEGLNVTTGVAIGASVSEADAAKFLYNFGVVTPRGDRGDIKYIFASIYYGRSLAEVMEDVVRAKVQTLVCNEFATRTLTQANHDSRDIMASVEKSLRDYLAKVGITLTFIGWADTWTFDPSVQKAIDDRFVAEQLTPVARTLEALTALKVQEGIATGIASHGMPFVITPDILAAFSSIGRNRAGEAAPQSVPFPLGTGSIIMPVTGK